MTTVETGYTLADMFRVTASLIRLEHQPGCPDFMVWRARAVLLEEAAEAEESGLPVSERSRSAAVSIAAAYLGAARPSEVPV